MQRSHPDCSLLCFVNQQIGIKLLQYCQQIFRQSLPALGLQFLRDTVEGFRHAASNAGQSITVTTQRHRSANYILKRLAFQERGDGFGDGFLAGFHMIIVRSNFIAGAV